jgi:hypothetical protein
MDRQCFAALLLATLAVAEWSPEKYEPEVIGKTDVPYAPRSRKLSDTAYGSEYQNVRVHAEFLPDQISLTGAKEQFLHSVIEASVNWWNTGELAPSFSQCS